MKSPPQELPDSSEVSSGERHGADDAAPSPSRWWRIWLPLIIAAVAFACRLVPVLRGAGISNQDYDPAVYYSAAVGLFSGLTPYHDFLLLHPPGILIALAPIAAIGAIVGDPAGMAMARVMFMLLGSVSTVLIYRILLPQHRYAALVGAGIYAVWLPAIVSEQNIRLEGLATFLVLAGILAISRHGKASSWLRPAIAGALFGLAAAVKIWGVAPIVVLIVWLAWRNGLRPALSSLAGAAVAIGVVTLPFLIVAPQMWNLVVVDQLGRSRSTQPVAVRFADTLGLGLLPRLVAIVPLILICALTAVALYLAWRSTLGQLSVLLVVVTSITLLASPTWFAHYAAFAAGPLCLVYGTAAGQATTRALNTARRRSGAIAGAAATLCALAAVMAMNQEGVPIPGSFLASALANRPGCVTTDNPATLIYSDTLRRNIKSGCPLVVDLGGYVYDIARQDGIHTDRAGNPDYQRFAMKYLRSGTSTIMIRFGTGDLTSTNAAVIRSWPIITKSGSVAVRRPTG